MLTGSIHGVAGALAGTLSAGTLRLVVSIFLEGSEKPQRVMHACFLTLCTTESILLSLYADAVSLCALKCCLVSSTDL